MEIKENQVYTVVEATELLKLNNQTVSKLVREKKIKAMKVGNKYRILGSDILNFLKGGKDE